MRGKKINLVGKSRSEIDVMLRDQLDEPFRTNQIYSWIYDNKISSFDEMTNLSKDLRASLEEKYSLSFPRIQDISTSDDRTSKYLLSLEDDVMIEVVKMGGVDHDTLCLSSQAGCPLDCVFCATGRGGFDRNLSCSEIIGSALLLIRELKSQKPVNIVFMGMGEPLLNYDEVSKSIRILTDPKGMAIPERRITLSTVGILGKIRSIKKDFPRIGLAISVNAVSDSLRSELMPINKTNRLEEVIAELKGLKFTRENPLTFEYVLISGVNEGRMDASKLAAFAISAKAKINVIPFNKIEGYNGSLPSEKTIDTFVRSLVDSGVNVTVRRSKGLNLSAACGQLKAGRKSVLC